MNAKTFSESFCNDIGKLISDPKSMSSMMDTVDQCEELIGVLKTRIDEIKNTKVTKFFSDLSMTPEGNPYEAELKTITYQHTGYHYNMTMRIYDDIYWFPTLCVSDYICVYGGPAGNSIEYKVQKNGSYQNLRPYEPPRHILLHIINIMRLIINSDYMNKCCIPNKI